MQRLLSRKNLVAPVGVNGVPLTRVEFVQTVAAGVAERTAVSCKQKPGAFQVNAIVPFALRVKLSVGAVFVDEPTPATFAANSAANSKSELVVLL